MTKAEIRTAIDADNGAGYSSNINLNGYVFTKNGSFIVFELKLIEDVKVCHIKYIHWKNEKDLMTILAVCCNFWMGNHVQFLFYREKHRVGLAAPYLKELGFRQEILKNFHWKWRFDCNECKKMHKNGFKNCTCNVYSMYK